MIAVVRHAEVSRQRRTPGGSTGTGAAVFGALSNLLFTGYSCGRTGCTAGFSQTKVANDIMARVSFRLTCCVRDGALRFWR